MKNLILTLTPFLFLFAEDPHDFFGKHFLASYSGCSAEAISNIDQLIQTMDKAVESSGATILNRSYHIFPPSGITIAYLLSESHATIHTYPEYNACFVDLFTCGNECTSENFDTILRDYLQATETEKKLLIRHRGIEETQNIR